MEKTYRIRMITLHLDCRRLDDPIDALEEASSTVTEMRDFIVQQYSRDVWTKRIVLDYCTSEQANDVIETYTADREELISLGNYISQDIDLDFLDRLTEEGYFASLLLKGDWQEARKVSDLIHKLAEKDPSKATHIGINTLGERVNTPYFPLASTRTHMGVSVGLLYPNYLTNAYRRGVYRELVNSIKIAAEEAWKILRESSKGTNMKPLGVDLSVSPWMEESTLGLVEYIAGVRLPEPGIAYGISLVNRALLEASRTMPTIGFNEVQLPIAEDLKMKARVSELNTTARDLARLSGVCLAGLDLAVVPADVDRVAGLLLEVRGYSLTKNKPLGVRIIPVEDVEPGDKVYLEKFGETPVIPI